MLPIEAVGEKLRQTAKGESRKCGSFLDKATLHCKTRIGAEQATRRSLEIDAGNLHRIAARIIELALNDKIATIEQSRKVGCNLRPTLRRFAVNKDTCICRASSNCNSQKG